ncbi:MAG: sulfite exporter TauE/SafE family protein [Dactylosporangium sp.]|nr:sulfite exporter TauE/SafE family protein [Dactylosporangium sp.]
MLVLTLVAAAAVGVILGLLGGGGSILAVPILVYLAQVEPKPAIAASLFIVGVASLVGLATHARAGRVRWRTGVLFGAAAMAGAYAGGRLAEYVPATILLAGFGLMMAATAVAMLRPRPVEPSAETGQAPVDQHLWKILGEGVTVGMVTGLVGAGGGFLVVPALVLLGGLTMPQAVGTSLLVIAMKSFAGFAGYLHAVTIDWPLTLTIAGLAVLGGIAGGRLVGLVDARVLRPAFGWFVVVMAVFVLAMQVPGSVWSVALHPAIGIPLVALPLVVVSVAVARRRRGSRSG